MRQLSAQDASFLYLESQGAHLHLTALYIYDQATSPGGIVRHKDVLKYVESRLHTSPIFRQKLVSLPLNVDYPYWVDDDKFDIEFHIRHIALPEPRDWRQLCILAARIHSRPLDLSRPPWQMHLVEGLDNIKGIPKGAFAIIAKYHHAAIDGATGGEIVSGLHSTTPEHDPNPEPEPWEPEPRPSWIGLMARAAVNNIREPFQLAKTTAATLPAISRSLLKGELPEIKLAGTVPDTRFNRPVSPRRVVEGVTFKLNQLADIRKAVPGATVNDVVLAVCGGALRCYLEEKAELPDDSLIAMAPINTRNPDEVGVAGNVLAAMSVPLYTDIADPLARLQAVREATANAKETEHAISARQMTDITKHIPSATMALAGRLVTGLGLGHRAMRLCNCTVTNVPGVQQPLYFNGAKLIKSTGFAPVIDGVGLIISAISYNGEIIFSFTGCREITPDPERLPVCTTASFNSLKEAAAARIAKKKTRGKQKISKRTKAKTKRRTRATKNKKARKKN
jgi:WS/DGAT/MGAT family acyltransferase